MRRRLFFAALLAAPALAAQEAVIEAGREREVLALLSPHSLAREVTPGWKLWNVSIGARAIELELRGPGDARALVRLAERGDAAEHSPSFGITRDAAARQGAARAAADALVAAVQNNDAGGFWRVRTLAPPVTAPSPAPSGLAWPAGVAAASIALMWWLARRA